MLRRSFPAALGLAAAGLLAAPALADHHEKSEMMKAPDISGVYKLTGGEKYGEKIPADRLKDNTSTIVSTKTGEGRWAVVDKDQADLYASDYKIGGPAKDADGKVMKDVYEIDLVSEIPERGSKAPGLVKLGTEMKDGKKVVTKLTLIYALDGVRPTDLKTEGKQLAFMMTRTAAPATEDGTPADEDAEQG